MKKNTGVVLVSNRGPVSFIESDEGYELKRGAGGLAGAMDPVARELGEEAMWIACATSATDREAVSRGATDRLQDELGYRVRLLDIDPDTYAQYYDVVSNRMLWFANHCLWDELGIGDFGEDELKAWESAYLPVNVAFASAVLEESDADDLILFQDYHLSVAPRLVREQRPEQTIFHFTHSSFCAQGLERVPEAVRTGVIEGLLGTDLLGFHVAAWVDAFIDCCDEMGYEVDRRRGCIEHQGRTTWVRAYPIPIDAPALQELAGSEVVRTWGDRFLEESNGPAVVRADRTEPSKNIVRGFEAFGALLDRREDLRHVTFFACLYGSRQSMKEYQRYLEDIEASIARVNERHPDAIRMFLKDDYERTLGALSVYDVLLVNPIMDGMNLVSKEGVAVNRRNGALVLSRGAGSFQELGEYAVRIEDALDIEETAAAIERALELSEEDRRSALESERAVVESTKPEDWIYSQIDDLEAIADGGQPPMAPSPNGP
ncbi:MAG: alpha,alpha-trehalose-phosphate synthase (UDP-forming) [Actinomycetota bacterium]